MSFPASGSLSLSSPPLSDAKHYATIFNYYIIQAKSLRLFIVACTIQKETYPASFTREHRPYCTRSGNLQQTFSWHTSSSRIHSWSDFSITWTPAHTKNNSVKSRDLSLTFHWLTFLTCNTEYTVPHKKSGTTKINFMKIKFSVCNTTPHPQKKLGKSLTSF